MHLLPTCKATQLVSLFAIIVLAQASGHAKGNLDVDPITDNLLAGLASNFDATTTLMQPNDVQLQTGSSFAHDHLLPSATKTKLNPCDSCLCGKCPAGQCCDSLPMLSICMCMQCSEKCLASHAKVNCAVSGWGVWSKCSKGCGSGSRTRTRKVTKEAKNGGAKCSALKATQKCNTHACPVNCAVNAWGAWGKCSKTCGSGLQKRSRSVKVQPKHGGQKCPAVSESKKCNTHGCCKSPSKSTKDAGYPDNYRGWYDVQGCGKCLDYCRWVGGTNVQCKNSKLCKSGGNPAKRLQTQKTWWSCRRAGTSEAFSPRGTFKSWKFKKCTSKWAKPPK